MNNDIVVPEGAGSQFKTTCPKCSQHRKNKDEPCLSVNLDLGVWNCHHCGYTGGSGKLTKISYADKVYEIPNYRDCGLCPEALEYFRKRGISEQTLKMNQIGGKITRFSSRDEADCLVLAFPYIKDKIVNVQFRAEDKRFKMAPKAEVCMYGFQNMVTDGVVNYSRLYITEGQVDALSLYETGFQNVMSVPNGSPFEEEGKAKRNPPMEFLEDPDFVSLMSSISEVVFVTDTDYQGRRLREELAKRLGVDKCYKVSYPSDCKDANDVLVKHGPQALVDCLLSPSPMIDGLCQISDLEDSLLQFYAEGLTGGISTGIQELDEVFTLGEGQLVVVTGTPESYKSVFVENIAVNIAVNYGYHTAIYSPESQPVQMQIARMCSMHNGLKFGEPDDHDRMPYQDFKKSYEFLNKHITFMQPPNHTLDELLDLYQVSILANGTKVCILDPYSKINWEGDDEHKFIRTMLNRLGAFAVKNKIIMILVAHPRKMTFEKSNDKHKQDEDKEYAVVQPYDIAGSSSFFNSTDVILSLRRSRFNIRAPLQVYVQKSKLWNIAKSGSRCTLPYNFSNWRLGNKISMEEFFS